MANQDPGTAIDVVSRIDADTLRVRTRLVVDNMQADAECTVSRGDPDFEYYENKLNP